MDLQLAGKRAVVTGASRGIGKAIAAQLIDEGVSVVLAALTPERLEAAADELRSRAEAAARISRAPAAPKVVAIQADAGDDESVRQLFVAAAEALGGIDILVNSAGRPSGQGAPPKVVEATAEQFWADANVKVMGALRCMREVVPHMKGQGWGRIINIDGLGARQTGNVLTSMRNSALAALSKNAADELGQFGINVTVVHPGLVRTEATPAVMAARAAATGSTVDEIEARIGATYAIGRFCDADEVAHVVTFLASPLSVSLCGDPIVASGGVKGPIHY